MSQYSSPSPPPSVPSHGPDAKPSEATQRRKLHIILRVLLGATVLGIIMAAILMRTWAMFWAAVILCIPYFLLLSAPFWLARLSGGGDPEEAGRTDKP